MEWVIVIVCLIGYIIYKYGQKQLDNQMEYKGGISNLCESLINRLTDLPWSIVSEITPSKVVIRGEENNDNFRYVIFWTLSTDDGVYLNLKFTLYEDILIKKVIEEKQFKFPIDYSVEKIWKVLVNNIDNNHLLERTTEMSRKEPNLEKRLYKY